MADQTPTTAAETLIDAFSGPDWPGKVLNPKLARRIVEEYVPLIQAEARAETEARVAGQARNLEMILAEMDRTLHNGSYHPKTLQMWRGSIAHVRDALSASPVPSALLDLRAPETVERVAQALHDSEYHPCTGDFTSCDELGGRFESWRDSAAALLAALLTELDAPKP